MRIRTRSLTGLALFAGVMLIVGGVYADVAEGPVEGEFVYSGTAAPASQWTDDQGILHIWGIPYELTATSGDLEIKITGVCNHNRDPETGDGNLWGDDHTVEVTWGDRTGTFQGRHSGTSINWRGYVAHVSHGISGDFVGMELRLNAVYFYTEKRGVFEGAIYTPSEGYDEFFGRGQVTEGSVEGEFVYGGTAAPESQWTDDQGILHIWGIPYELTATSDDVEIKITGVCNHNRDPETGDGNLWGDDHIVEVSWGDRTGTFRGHHSGTSINWRGYVAHVSHGISGDFVGMELRLSAVYFYAEKRGVFEANIYTPPEDYEEVFSWDKATSNSVEGEFVYAGTAAPASQWTDDQNVLHIWGIPYELTATSDDVEIKITGVCNHNRDPETGDGNLWGDDHTIEVTWGDRTGTFQGRHSGASIKWRGYVTHVSYGISGDFVGAKLELDAVYFYTEKRGVFKGTIYTPPEGYDNVFFMSLAPGLNMVSLPLEPRVPYSARSFAEEIGATIVIKYDEALRKFVGFTLNAPGNGFLMEGGKGYIVNTPAGGVFPCVGAAWTNEPPVAAPPPAQTTSAWAFMVSGSVLDSLDASDERYTAVVKNLRTGETLTEAVGISGYFASASADLNRRAIISAGDQVEVAVFDSSGDLVSGPFIHDITLDDIRNAVVNVRLRTGEVIPEKSALLQNYPNPFNPETWIPYHLKDANPVVIRIHNASGQLVRTLDLGYREAGVYASRSRGAYWDGRNESGEQVASGIYFYSITAGDFSATRKMTVTK